MIINGFVIGLNQHKVGGDVKEMDLCQKPMHYGPTSTLNPGSPPPRVTLNEWMDIRAGDPWPTRPFIKVLRKVDVRNEGTSAAFNRKENVFVGPTVHPFMVDI